jgi:hypothetical protein
MVQALNRVAVLDARLHSSYCGGVADFAGLYRDSPS